MSKPRIFVSSTYYDLKHIRASLAQFIESLGFDSVLFENGDITYFPDKPLEESCYREAESADIFVLLVGGAYGSKATGDNKTSASSSFERYDSITKMEYESAFARGVPIYVLVERGVYGEYQTYLKNKGNESVKYAHVDSENVFAFLDDILAKPINRTLHAFDKFEDIQGWLREQWAGLFRDLLQKRSDQQELSSLAAQIGGLQEINETLKKYLEEVMKAGDEEKASKLIEHEEHRLEEARRQARLKQFPAIKLLIEACSIPSANLYQILLSSETKEEFLDATYRYLHGPHTRAAFKDILESFSDELEWDLVQARQAFSLSPFPDIYTIILNEPVSDEKVRGGRLPPGKLD